MREHSSSLYVVLFSFIFDICYYFIHYRIGVTNDRERPVDNGAIIGRSIGPKGFTNLRRRSGIEHSS